LAEAELDETIETTVADSADNPEEPQRAGARSSDEALARSSRDHDLVYYHEKSVEACALILNIPAATVKTRMFYARKKLAAGPRDLSRPLCF
jgi:RNA polymerase sigma-70 factor, ECF subfamily